MAKNRAQVAFGSPFTSANAEMEARVERLEAGITAILMALHGGNTAPKEPKNTASPKGKKASPKGKAQKWIADFGAKKAARRRLAAEMRAKRIPITEASWAAAKREAGIA